MDVMIFSAFNIKINILSIKQDIVMRLSEYKIYNVSYFDTKTEIYCNFA